MLSFSKKSWHYRMARITTNCAWEVESMNFCQYARRAMLGLSLFTTGVTVASLLVVFAITGYIFLFNHGFDALLDAPNFAVPVFVFTILVFGALLLFLDQKYDFTGKIVERRRERAMQKFRKGSREPSLFVAWYRAWKDKFCPNIKFKD